MHIRTTAIAIGVVLGGLAVSALPLPVPQLPPQSPPRHSAAAKRPATVAPAIIYAKGGKFDRSFNEAMHQGAVQFSAVTGIPYVDFEISTETQYEQVDGHFAARGKNPVMAVGFPQTDAVRRAAKAYPDSHFVIIDARVDLPNVLSIEFKEHEGSFLVGMLAAYASKTGKIGMVGGMDVPLIRRVACGYTKGAKYANPNIQVIVNMAGTTSAAWTDPARGAEIARDQFDRGVDVVFAAAGTTGLGALQAAADRGKLAIGVDSNQNYLHPGTMLTSMLKRTDKAAFDTLMAARAGNWQSGHRVMGLKEGGVDWAYDRYNAQLVTPAMRAAVDRAKADIIAGKITVHDYESDNRCD